MKVFVVSGHTDASVDVPELEKAFDIFHLKGVITELVGKTGTYGCDDQLLAYAKKNELPIRFFNHDWMKYQGEAPEILDARMVSYADAVVVIGYKHDRDRMDKILNLAKKRNIPHYTYSVVK